MKTTSIIYKIIISIYYLLPFKKGICVILKKLNLPIEKLYKDLKFKGKFSAKIEDKTFHMYAFKSTIENEVFWKGSLNSWEKDSIWLWKYLSEKIDVILDVGANSGLYSLISKTVNPNSTIYAFEPSPAIFSYLEKNNEINGYNISCQNMAISNQNGQFTFYDTEEALSLSGSLSEKMLDNSKNQYLVQTSTLDKFIEEKQLSKIDLLKIDVEMHEKEVLENFTISKDIRPIIIIEILTDEIANFIGDKLQNTSYTYFRIRKNKLTQIKQLEKGEPYNWNFLLIPEEKLNLIKQFI